MGDLNTHLATIIVFSALPSSPKIFDVGCHNVQTLREGLDGIEISPDGSTVYYSAPTSDHLYSIPTANLLAAPSNPLAEIAAAINVTNHGQRDGNANGFEGDSNGLI